MFRRSLLVFLLLLALGAVTAWAGGLSPLESLKRFKVPDGFEVQLIASEPEIRQPVTITFDDRGRMWVVQYIQYPTPAGLKPVKVDQYLRTAYDRVPPPPPRGPKGADRVTIVEEWASPSASAGGMRDRHAKVKDFVGGLNLASGLALGHGGVFVLQAPYLLFYPDRKGDDAPDGDPEVLLTGFGMEDAHAVANSLQWGPDGWLYGTQGSTVTAHIRAGEQRGPFTQTPSKLSPLLAEFQQGIWRYHPRTKEFELFSEGGGNTWGLDFDRHGNAIAGTNYGGVVALHQVQGGYYVKGFAKHVPLHNPYTFGYFDHVPYADAKRLAGDHISLGGIVYQGGAFPKEFNDVYISCSLLHGAVYWHPFDQKASSFTSRWGGALLTTDDQWFRPVDTLVGPDGALYVADWYDIRSNHVDPVDTWDKTTGRIYRVAPKGLKTAGSFDLRKKSSDELVDLLSHPNSWYSGEARRLLAERRDALVWPRLRRLIEDNTDDLALQALWALYVSGGFNEDVALRYLEHENADVRVWTIRFLGDAKRIGTAIQTRLTSLARTEPDCHVRSQLACSCKRLPGRDSLPIVEQLLRRDEDMHDPHIPLLLWWAVEDKAVSDRDRIAQFLERKETWQLPLVRQVVIERLGRRYAADGTDAGYEACARLLALAPGASETELVIRGIEKELAGHPLPSVPESLRPALARLWSEGRVTSLLIRFGLGLGSAEAHRRALDAVRDSKTPDTERAALLDVVGQAGKPEAVPVLLGLVGGKESIVVQHAALAALRRYPEPRIAEELFQRFQELRPEVRGRTLDLLCSRKASAFALLREIDAGKIDGKSLGADQLRQIATLNDAELTKILEKHYGQIRKATPGEMTARINSIRHELGRMKGDPANGKMLFTKHCATCHQLLGEGTKIGPDLTGADRNNRDFLVTNVVDPNAAIRPEYTAYVVETKDGRVLTGLLAESTPQTMTLLDAKNMRTVLPREQIEEMKASPVSLMPEKLLDPLSMQEIVDLFTYMQTAK